MHDPPTAIVTDGTGVEAASADLAVPNYLILAALETGHQHHLASHPTCIPSEEGTTCFPWPITVSHFPLPFVYATTESPSPRYISSQVSLPPLGKMTWCRKLTCSSVSTAPLLLRFTCHPCACSLLTSSTATANPDLSNGQTRAVTSCDVECHASCVCYTSALQIKALHGICVEEPLTADSTPWSLVSGTVYSAHVHPVFPSRHFQSHSEGKDDVSRRTCTVPHVRQPEAGGEHPTRA
mmetsp:Transcript_4960/g.31763  ORF Transcript_4960/g.31763 Transcript_4960/m.31763 type:complete len:238 (+) Transcript_4960:1625-2338(+)